MFYVFGDSHVRIMSNNGNFLPIFIGQGNSHNFVTFTSFIRILIKTLYIASVTKGRQKVVFFFGEPDSRYALGRGWYPWDEDSPSLRVSDSQMDLSASRYLMLIDAFKSLTDWDVFVLSILPTQQPEQFKHIQRLNELVRKGQSYLDFHFIDAVEHILRDDGCTIRDEYIGDVIHANTAIQSCIERLLVSSKHLREAKGSEDVIGGKELKRFFRANSRFGNMVLGKSIVAMCSRIAYRIALNICRGRGLKVVLP